MTKRLPSPEHADTLSLNALRSLVSGLLERSQQAEGRLEKLEADNIQLREENAALRLENTRLKLDNQLLRDEIARLKNLPPRPPFRSSGMDKATDAKSANKAQTKKKPRGAKLDVKRVFLRFLRPTVRVGYRKRNTMIAFLLGSILIALILFAGTSVGYRVNTTPSEPLGLWRILPLDRPISVGDLVFVCTPVTAPFSEARSRGYLHRGLCASGYAPLIKTVIALEGQRVDVGAELQIDGLTIPASKLQQKDGAGRPLLPYAGGVVPIGMVFLHSPFAASWDSRYFGPIPASGILGLAQEVLTYAP